MQKYHINPNDFVQLIERLAEENEITMDYISLEIRVDRSTISNYLSPRVDLSLTNAQKIIGAFGGQIICLAKEPVRRDIAEFSMRFGSIFYNRFWKGLYADWRAANEFGTKEGKELFLKGALVPYPNFEAFVNTITIEEKKEYYFVKFPEFPHLDFKGKLQEPAETPATDTYGICGMVDKPTRRRKPKGKTEA